MAPTVQLLIAQINPTVGHIRENAERMLSIIAEHANTHDLILFPELALSGYPPEDLLFKDVFHQQITYQLKRLAKAAPQCHVIVGHPERTHHQLFNTASVFYQGKKLAHYRKQCLPNDGVFDEKRYFTPGKNEPCILTLHGQRFAICICEDLWHPGPIEQLEHADVHCILSLNASPFDHTKYHTRVQLLQSIATKGFSIAYANLVGGQDELLFDGQSLFLNEKGQYLAHAKAFEPDCLSISLNASPISPPRIKEDALLYQALVTATRDYLTKKGFAGALLGLSGGIDSALTLAIAVDAVGAAHVTAVTLPSRYTSSMSVEDAEFQIQALNVKHHHLSIEPMYERCLTTLQPLFSSLPIDFTEENIQARIRSLLLMALSNKFKLLLLSTTNKSELAMGYGTLYGDLAGGFAILKDVYKTKVYELARYRNQRSLVIPTRVLTRQPSAELSPNQTDQDTLPPYDLLDRLIQAYVEHNQTIQQLLAQGFTARDVHFVINRLHQQEYKRKQAPLGPKLTPLAFGRDWRFPV